MDAARNPLISRAPPEVPLPKAPLIRVISQIRFHQVLAVGKKDFVAPFQEAIRKTYGVLEAEEVQDVVLSPSAGEASQREVVWRFSDLASEWRVSLAPSFIALETRAYQSRADFLRRLREVVEAVSTHIAPAAAQRIGLRYIDRVTGESLDQMASLVRKEFLGIVGSSLVEYIAHSTSETLFQLPQATDQLMVRWGMVPPHVTVDPNVVEPIGERSWLLDIDMFSTQRTPFDTDSLVSQTERYAERVYTFFRWAVKDEFLSRYGGKP